MSLTEQKGVLEFFITIWPDKKTNPFLPTHPIEGSLARLLSERQSKSVFESWKKMDFKELDSIDKKFAILCSTAEKCHMKDDDLREKLNEILAGEDEKSNDVPQNPKNTLALVEFKVLSPIKKAFEVFLASKSLVYRQSLRSNPRFAS